MPLSPQPSQAILPGLIGSRTRLVAFIGGGGKTGLMYLWARCLKAAGFSVITAATTKLSAAPQPGVDFIHTSKLAAARFFCARIPDSKNIPTLYAGLLTEVNKLEGLPPEWLDKLSQEFPETIFLVEADGSAGRSLKGHGPHEPVIPNSAGLVVPIIGLDSHGQTMSEIVVHRPEIFCRITGAKMGDCLTEAHIASVLLNPAGYLAKAPPGAAILPFLNKAETPAAWEVGRALARTLLAAHYAGLDRILLGSIQQNQFEVWP